MSNYPPYVSLELNKDDAEWLSKLIAAHQLESEYSFAELCRMPSSDPRSNMRAILTMAAAHEQDMSENLLDRIVSQQPDIQKAIKKHQTSSRKILDAKNTSNRSKHEG